MISKSILLALNEITFCQENNKAWIDGHDPENEIIFAAMTKSKLEFEDYLWYVLRELLKELNEKPKEFLGIIDDFRYQIGLSETSYKVKRLSAVLFHAYYGGYGLALTRVKLPNDVLEMFLNGRIELVHPDWVFISLAQNPNTSPATLGLLAKKELSRSIQGIVHSLMQNPNTSHETIQAIFQNQKLSKHWENILLKAPTLSKTTFEVLKNNPKWRRVILRNVGLRDKAHIVWDGDVSL